MENEYYVQLSLSEHEKLNLILPHYIEKAFNQQNAIFLKQILQN